jgi:lipopolysaccharide heptosyltransferase I
MNILLVRLGALGDVVHAVPAAAAIRRAFPAARLDWLVEAKHREMVDLVSAVDRTIAIERRSLRGWLEVTRELRRTAYDVAVDLQGLLKSAVLARASGAARVVGFSLWHLREKTARPFYTTAAAAEGEHVIYKNLRLLATLGIEDDAIDFPLRAEPSRALDALRARVPGPFALVNAGAAWPNKRWPPRRYAAIAAFLHDVAGLTPVVLWGPGEELLRDAVVAAASGTAVAAPPTRIADLIALAREAALVVSGDTGPLHIAAAAGTPAVAIFGPTDPARNGPWRADDIAISRFEACGCHYDRRCHQSHWCLADIEAAEVCAAIQQRLAAARGPRG